MKTSNDWPILFVACLIVLLIGLGSQASGQEIVVLDEIVARINQETITMTDFEEELAKLRLSLTQEFPEATERERQFEQLKDGLLKTVIDNRMLVQRAEELGISANIDIEVDKTLEQMRQQSGIPSMEVLEQYLEEQGTSLEQYRDNLRERLIIDSMIQQFVYSKITLLTPEIEAYYRDNIAKFTEPEEVELSEILFLTEDKEKELVRKKAGEVLSKLRAGTSFEEMAEEYSEGPTASRGGRIGSFKTGSMASSLEQVAFALEEGEISGLVETDYGLQILKVIGKQPPQEKPLEEVRSEISSQLYQEKAAPELKEFMDMIREETYIHIAPKYKENYDVEGY